MDIPQFVRLRAVLTSSADRRYMLRGLTALALLGTSGPRLDEAEARLESSRTDKKRLRKSWFCLEDRSVSSRNKRKVKRLRRSGAARGKCNCVPGTRQVTCAGKCGRTHDNCGRSVDCGYSAVAPAVTNQATFGISGSGPGELKRPSAIAIADDNLVVYVADFNNNRISVWSRSDTASADWTNQATFGDSGPEKLDRPAGVTLSADELTLYVADYGNDRITIWSRPTSDSQAWVFVSAFGASGTFLGEFDGPRTIALASDELTMYVVDSNNGRFSIWTRPDTGSTNWVNPVRFGSKGTGPYELNQPMDLQLSADELTLYVADTNNFRISIWTRSATNRMDWNAQVRFGTQGIDLDQFLDPSGVTVAPDELTIWVADTDNNRVSVWSRPTIDTQTWSALSTFGTQGIQPSDFDDPVQTRVTADIGILWVVDHVNDRISVWTQTCPA